MKISMKTIWSKFPISLIGLIIGALCSILYAFGGFFIDLLVSLEFITSDETPGLSYGTVLAFGALIGMPLIFGTIGFIGDLIFLAIKSLFQLNKP